MPTPTTSTHTLPDASDFCPSCRRLTCRCSPEPEYPDGYWRAYARGHEDCIVDGYDQRPMTEHVFASGCRTVRDPVTSRTVHLMVPVHFRELTWRRTLRTAWAYRAWFERTYGLDLEGYLAGYDDAGAGLPSAADAPEAHAEAARRLDRYAHPEFGPVSG